MKLGSSNILGLAIGERSIACAQVSITARRRRVQRLARFPIPDDASFAQPDVLGQRLRTFLREHHFSASSAVVGVAARWLMAQEKEIPPADEKTARELLRLQAERLSLADRGEMVFDFAGPPDGVQPAKVLLVGMLREQLDRINRMCESAGLAPITVTATTIAFSELMGGGDGAPMLMLSRQGAEVIWRLGGRPRMLRHLPAMASAGASRIEALGSELRRTFALSTAPANGSQSLMLWDDWGLSPDEVRTLSDRLGLDVRGGHTLGTFDAELETGALNGSADQLGPQSFLPAVALAIAGDRRRSAPVDFRHTKLAPPRTSRFSRTARWSAGVAALLIVSIGSLFFVVHQREGEAARLEAQLVEMDSSLAAAEMRIGRVNYGRGYFETRTPVLDCLREVTLAFGRDEPVWATGFTLRDTGRGQLQGRAADQGVVLTVLDRLQENPRFADAQIQDIREASGEEREIVFAITFTFVTRE